MTQAESERRQATIVFADISGFTSMSEKMDPEEVTALMNECFGMLSEIILRNGGTIDKFIGDCIMALFGVPRAIENAPVKAVLSALELKQALNEFTRRKELTGLLDIHTGINTGMVVSGMIGGGDKKEYTVMGDAVNTASRLKDASGKGQIFVGEPTYKATHVEFEYRVLEPLTLKGKEQPVPVYELLSRKETAGAGQAGEERMIGSEMVGRDAELDKLHLHLLKVINGEGSVVCVTGEAGLGKSRLLAEFGKKDEIRKVHYHRGRALAIGKNLSYHPVVDILKNWAGIRENETGPAAAGKLEQAIRQIAPDEANEIYPFIATLMGYKLTGRYAERLTGIEGEALENLILKNFREMLIRGAALHPLVIEVEDLHWADTSSLELLLSLTRLAEKHRILFLTVFRPGYEETGEKFLRELRERYQNKPIETDPDKSQPGEGSSRAGGRFLEINLQPLSESQSEKLVFNLLRIQGLPGQLRRQIIERSEGNPYFIEEVIRSFIDDGVIEPGREGFVVTPKIDSVFIPHTINDLLMSRIDRLDEKTRSIVKTASVIGRHFFYRILTQVAETTTDIDDRLRYLETIQMIREGDRKEELEYLFKHALAQEAAYESILLAKRKVLHHHIAESIETIFSERLSEFYGMLAMHYSKAENMEKTEEYLVKAGEEALRSAASSEALHFYKEALEIYQNKYGVKADPAKVAMMEKNIAMAYFIKGQNIEALEYFDRVLAWYGIRTPDNTLLRTATLLKGVSTLITGLYLPVLKWKRTAGERDNEVIQILYTESRVLATLNPKRSLIGAIRLFQEVSRFNPNTIKSGLSIFGTYATLFTWIAQYTISKKFIGIIEAHFEREKIRNNPAYLTNRVMNGYFSGSWDIDPMDDKDIDLGIRTGDLWIIVTGVFYYGFLYAERGDFHEVEKIIKKLSEIADSYDNEYARSAMFRVKILYLLKVRKVNETLAAARESERYALQSGQESMLFSINSMKARAQLYLGNAAEAILTLESNRAMIHKVRRFPIYLGYYYLTRQLYDLLQFEHAMGIEDKEKKDLCRKTAFLSCKRAMANSKNVASDRTEVNRLMGIYYWLTGDQKKALMWWERSIREGERLGARVELSRTYYEVGKRLKETKSKYHQLKGVTAEEYLQRAGDMFTEMGLEWDLEQLDQLRV